jgi:sigma-B regulation protein RsbU (phosphoserine phosphatase)
VAKKILIIDDDRAIRDMLCAYLRRGGYDVRTASDGAMGLGLVRDDAPDAVLCDLRMPGMGGLEVLPALAADFPRLPVLIVSGTGDLSDAIQTLKLGAWDYVTKPVVDLAVLDHALDKALERARLLAENDAYRAHLEAANAELARSLRQLEADEASGREIQFALLPRTPMRHDSLEFSRYLATSAIMSGDFVDYFVIDASRIGFYIADVAGHGVASAVITVMLKSHTDRHLEDFLRHGDPTIVDPATLLARLNREVLTHGNGKYLTIFYGVIDTSARQLLYANGGQFPFPYLFDGTSVTEIGGRSPPVGLFDDARYANAALDIPREFALRLYSDGVLELLPPDGLANRKELLRAASRDALLDAEGLALRIGLLDQAAPPDDVTVLSIRRISNDGS